MTFEDLAKSLYEDLNGSIVRIESNSDVSYSVWIACDDWDDQDRRRSFKLIFKDVAETDCDTGFCGCIFSASDHVILWNHNAPQESVYFSKPPRNPEEVIGKIYEAHNKLFQKWRSMFDYWLADSSTLAGGHGILFRGPTPLVNLYCTTLDGIVSYSRVSSYTPAGGYSAFILEDNFVIAKSVVVIEEDSEQYAAGQPAISNSIS